MIRAFQNISFFKTYCFITIFSTTKYGSCLAISIEENQIVFYNSSESNQIIHLESKNTTSPANVINVLSTGNLVIGFRNGKSIYS